MASCITTQWVNYAPQAKLTVTQSSSTATAATLSWVLEYIAEYAASSSVAKAYTVVIGGTTVKEGTFSINGKTGTHTVASGTYEVTKGTTAKNVSFSVSFGFNLTWSDVYAGTRSASGSIAVAAKTSYAVSYNANGGTGAPSSQTKWYGTALTLSSAKPTRTGYTFKGWATSASGAVAYAAGASYTANANVTLYAVWQAYTYTVKFDANGGTGAPANQTKTYGTTLKLSSTKPTRTNYAFLGWGTSASATTVSYAAGANYTTNAGITLYAVWELSYTKPRITNFSAVRGTYDGSTFAEDSAGATMRIMFSYACDLNSIVYGVSITNASGTPVFASPQKPLSALSGDVVSFFDISLSSDASYNVRLVLDDTGGATTAHTTLNGEAYTVDFLSGGKGVAFGKPAEIENLCDIQFQTRLNGGLLYPLLPAETDLNAVRTPNTYIGENVAHYNYENCPVTNGTFTLTVESCGDAGQVKQTFTTCSKYKPEAYSRFYYQESWGDWWVASTDEVVLYENNSGTTGAITFQLGSNANDNPAASNYRYLEIYYTDNNGKSGGYTKVWNPNGKTVCLSIVEASSTIYSRQTMYTISGSTITPIEDSASYFRISSAGVVSTSIGYNYIKIVRIIGRA